MLRTRDSGGIDAVLSLAPVRDARGRVVSAMGVIVDVTARKAAEDGLRASQERFKALVHHSSDFLVVCDDSGIVTYASPSVNRFTGFDLVDESANGLVDLLHPDDIDGAAAAFAASDVGRFTGLRDADASPRWCMALDGDHRHRSPG